MKGRMLSVCVMLVLLPARILLEEASCSDDKYASIAILLAKRQRIIVYFKNSFAFLVLPAFLYYKRIFF